ncbi:MAG: cysteine desulfurase [Spirochaetaceae bacterium]|nr:cysteine desulfurase [Spirochaetaceae bacterium]
MTESALTLQEGGGTKGRPLYFDWAATAMVEEDIIREAAEIAINHFGNPSSLHFLGSDAKNTLAQVRSDCAKTLQVKSDNLFFTSGGTEANHLPLLSLLQRPAPGTIIISAIEHPAIREQAEMLKHCDWKVLQAAPDATGIVPVAAIEKLLTNDTVLVCLMAVNNETGAIQPIYQVADLLNKFAKETGKRRPKLHVDCVQAAGKIPLNLSYPGIDSAAFSAHKIGGPRGIGILYLAQRFESFVRGGGQEQGIRSGTENIAGAWAFSKCLERHFLSEKNTEGVAYQHFLQQKAMTDNFIAQLKEIKGCGLIPQTRDTDALKDKFSPWIVQVAFEGIPGEVLVRALSEKSIAISTGSACSSRKLSRPVLEAMGVSKELATNGVRFSFGPKTQQQDLDKLLEALKEIRQFF